MPSILRGLPKLSAKEKLNFLRSSFSAKPSCGAEAPSDGQEKVNSSDQSTGKILIQVAVVSKNSPKIKQRQSGVAW
jgi:hypothetical protein